MLIWFELKSILVPDKVCFVCVCGGGGGGKSKKGKRREEKGTESQSLLFLTGLTLLQLVRSKTVCASHGLLSMSSSSVVISQPLTWIPSHPAYWHILTHQLYSTPA